MGPDKDGDLLYVMVVVKPTKSIVYHAATPQGSLSRALDPRACSKSPSRPIAPHYVFIISLYQFVIINTTAYKAYGDLKNHKGA
jgi:hypothetical protein